MDIHERTRIEKRGEETAYTEDEGEHWIPIPASSTVSMNMWGFEQNFMQELERRFPLFLQENLPVNPLKCEFFLPSVVSELMLEGKAEVSVLTSKDRWYGVTYQEDKAQVMQALLELKRKGMYPEHLWEA